MKSISNIISKYYRIARSDEIRSFLDELQVYNLKESQVGNHVYSGFGSIKTMSSLEPIWIRIHVKNSEFVVLIKALGNLKICEFNPASVSNEISNLIKLTLN